MATKVKNQNVVSELESLFAKSNIAIATNLTGYTVSEINQFRRNLKANDASCKIAKNTLINIATANTAFSLISELTKGPTALVLGFADPTVATKNTFQYIDDLKKGEVKGAVMDGKLLTTAELKQVSKLPPKEELLAGIAGGLNSGASGVVGILNNIICDIALLVEEVAKKNAA